MKSKKTASADLQNKKNLFFEIGLALSLVIVLAAFNWNTAGRKTALFADRQTIVGEEENVPITIQEPPPPEIPPIQMLSEEITIIDNSEVFNLHIDFGVEETNKALFIGVDYIPAKPKNTAPETEVKDEGIPFAAVKEKPMFMGADANSFSRWVNSRINYPPSAQESNIHGTVYMSFDIDVDGSLSNIRITRSVDPLLDEEAMRVVRMSPKWTPGRQQNKPVKVSYQFSVKFRLQ
jgi:protein TonB